MDRTAAVLCGLGIGLFVSCDARDLSAGHRSSQVASPAGPKRSSFVRDATRVGPGLSDQDVAEIRSLVRVRDGSPILSIGRIPAVSSRLNRHGADVRATTGIERGHGRSFDLKKDQEKWSIVGEGSWVS